MAKSSFLRHAAVYGAGNLLVSAAGLLLLPLYVRCLSEAEYGTLDVFNRLGEYLDSFGRSAGAIAEHDEMKHVIPFGQRKDFRRRATGMNVRFGRGDD